MHRERQIIIGLGALAVLLLALGVSQYLAVQRLEAGILSLEEQLARESGALAEQIGQVRSALNETAGELRETIGILEQAANSRMLSLEREIVAVRTESKTGLETLQKELGDIQLKSNDFTAILDDLLPSVVSIRTDTGLGSGVIVDPAGYVLTNYHVVEDIRSGNIWTYTQHNYGFSIVGADPASDLALLKITTKNRTFDALPFADSREVKAGTRVIALGSPGGFDFTVTEGIVSATGRQGASGTTYVQTDVPINPGSSGGPLVNIQGEIVGINTMKIRGSEGLGFAIEADVAREFVDDAIAQHKAQVS